MSKLRRVPPQHAANKVDAAASADDAVAAWAAAENESWRGRAIGRVHTRFTRNGLHMAFVAIFAVLGGSVRGFNLLVILAGLMVGILIMQWRFCRGTLPGLTVHRTPPPEAFAGTPFKMRFEITNHRRWLPAWLIRLEDQIRGRHLPGRGIEAVTSVGIIRPGTSELAAYDCLIARRGRYRFGPVRLATGFPFGLINAWKNTRTPAALIVFPQLAKLKPRWSGIIENRREGLAASRNSSGPNEGEFFGIRNWQSGDSQRWIHWRTTARIGELAVRQFEQRNRTQLSLLLDPYSELAEDQDDPNLEWAISVAAAVVVEVASLATSRLAFGIADADAQAMFSQRVSNFRRAGLQMLATVKPSSEPPLTATLVKLLQYSNPNWPIMVVSPRGPRLDLLAASSDDHREGIPSAVLSRLDIIWLDVTSEACQRIAVPIGTDHATH